MHNIGLIGKARSGKDSAAAHLVRSYAYTRLAFADPLKAFALDINPWIDGPQPRYPAGWTIRLADMIEHIGWERAKDEYPEVRRVLQHIGQAKREIDEDFWLRELMRKVAGAAKLNMPVVVTDVRYRNEALSLRRAGFKLIRITRPLPAEPFVQYTRTALHASETELDDFAADVDVVNDGSLEALYAMISAQI